MVSKLRHIREIYTILFLVRQKATVIQIFRKRMNVHIWHTSYMNFLFGLQNTNQAATTTTRLCSCSATFFSLKTLDTFSSDNAWRLETNLGNGNLSQVPCAKRDFDLHFYKLTWLYYYTGCTVHYFGIHVFTRPIQHIYIKCTSLHLYVVFILLQCDVTSSFSFFHCHVYVVVLKNTNYYSHKKYPDGNTMPECKLTQMTWLFSKKVSSRDFGWTNLLLFRNKVLVYF